VPVTHPTARLERHDRSSGAWVVVEGEPGRVRVRSGVTGNRVDPNRRVPRSCWEVRRIDGELELLATWPVSELVTHRIGEHVDQLVDDLTRAGGDSGPDLAEIGRILDPLLADDRPHLTLDARLWAAVYPLLRVPLDAGAVLDRVPVALDRTLRAPDARRATRAAFGRATRPLVRALAASLLPSGPGARVPFEPVLLALMASPWCGSEQLAQILSTTPREPGAVAFDVGEVERARTMFERVPSRRVAECLRQALDRPDGTRLLAEAIAAWRPPAPSAGHAGQQRAARRVATTPSLRPPPPTDVALRHPDDLRALEGAELAGHRIVLPRTADELVEWGRVLDNCLGGFRHAMAEGRSHVVGLTSRDGRLRYALELTRSRTVRQFEGPGNRQAPDRVTAPVLSALRERGVVRADGRRGHSLMAPR
jgi:PcfJ-like protein